MTILVALLVLAMPGITFTVAQEGTVPKETCQVLIYNFIHLLFTPPTVNITTLPGPSEENLKRLTGTITSESKCGIVTEIKVLSITPDEKFEGVTQTVTETIKIQVSATTDIRDPTKRFSELNTCLQKVQEIVVEIPLNLPDGRTKEDALSRETVEQQSCCHVIYGLGVGVNECCRPGFFEDGINCACPEGKFLNLNNTSCDDCPEDTYQENKRSSSCLRCPNGTTTYGRTGASSLSSCLEACQAGKRYNLASKKCQICPKNTFQPEEGKTTCRACPTNRVTKYAGSTKFEDCVQSCNPGSFYSFTSESCELCPQSSFQEKQAQFNCTPCETQRITLFRGSLLQEDCIINCSRGQFFNRTTQECQDCQLHTYQPAFGNIGCLGCPNGGITVNTSSKMLGDCIKNCSAGSIYNFKTKSCENCPLNSYQPKPGQIVCKICPIGTITVNVSTVSEEDCIEECDPGYRYNRQQLACFPCEINTYKPTKGETECIKCPNGTVTYQLEPNINITDCREECDRGYYFNLTAWRCEKCPRNTTQENKGQTICHKCPFPDRSITEDEGSISETDCIGICEAGSFFNKNLLNCQKCQENTYQPNSGTSKCLKCPDGHVTFEKESTDIRQCVKACPPGSHHVNKTERCTLCSNDSYQNEPGKDTCKKCWDGKLTLQDGSTKMEDCLPVCAPGEYLNNSTGKCEACPRNKYQPLGRQFSCTDCPKGSLTQRNRSKSMKDCLWDCDKGFFHNSTSNTCSECPIGTYKEIRGHIRCYDCDPGYTTLTTGSANHTHCILVCFEGNYYNNTLKRCMECPLNSYQVLNVSTSCLTCADNGITKETGSKSEEECSIFLAAEEGARQDLNVVVTIPVVLVVVVLSICLLGILYRRWRTKENERRMSSRPLDPRGRRSVDYEREERPKLDSIASMPNHHYKMKGSGLKPDVQRPSIRIANIPKELEIPRENLNFLGQVLGKGNFGKVEKAILVKDGTENIVAVKMIKGGGTFSDEKELFDELEMLASLYAHPHPNIVNLIGGSTTSDGPLFVVVEYCGEGNLLKYLQKNQVQARPKQEYVNIFPKAQKPGIQYEWKLQKALEVCSGMAHLAKFKIVHRDVAARNVLLDENWVAKISDFGMARDIYVKQIYRKDTEGFLPVRWMAIESLESFIYTTHSDVWSFGILLWEIISDGRVPYNNILDHTQLLNYIKSGRIMKRPKNCPKDFYHIMEKCWATNPSDRPSFESLQDAIGFLYDDEVHKDDALPQRIRRKFSSRRKRRKPDEDNMNSGGKSRVQKTVSNTSGTKIDKIEEEPSPKTGDKLEKDEIKMEVLDTPKDKENVTNKFDNKGYDRTSSATSEEQDVCEGENQKASIEKTRELDTISETPLRGQTIHDNGNIASDRTLLDSAGREPASSLQTDLGDELREAVPSGESDASSSADDKRTGPSKGSRMSSTEC